MTSGALIILRVCDPCFGDNALGAVTLPGSQTGFVMAMK